MALESCACDELISNSYDTPFEGCEQAARVQRGDRVEFINISQTYLLSEVFSHTLRVRPIDSGMHLIKMLNLCYLNRTFPENGAKFNVTKYKFNLILKPFHKKSC